MNADKLRGKFRENRLTLADVADIIGITCPTLHKKLKGISEFTRSEIVTLRKALHLTAEETEAIFFAS